MPSDINDEPKRRRRWLRFRLSSLFLVMLVMCCGLAWFQWISKVGREQQEAVQEIYRAGGSVRYDYECGVDWFDQLGPAWLEPILGQDFFACVIEANVCGDVDLSILRKLPRLGDLSVYRKQVSAADAAQLQHLTGLYSLTISVKDATDDDLKGIGRLPHLENLYVAKWVDSPGDYVINETRTDWQPNYPKASQVTDDGLGHLAQLAQLRTLALPNSRITDNGLRHLRSLTGLEHLDLSGTQVGDEGLARLKPLSNLKQLILSRTQVTDAGLAHLRDRPGLDDLDLKETAVSDAGIGHLLTLPNLTGLYLDFTRVTDAGVERLKELPNLCYLGLSGTRITDAGLRHVGEIEMLQSLSIVKTPVSPDGLACLNRLPKLTFLKLGGKEVTDDWLPRISEISRLWHLSFYDARITDDGLMDLKPLAGLGYLLLSGSNDVSDQGLARLEDALPDLTTSRTFPIRVRD